MKNFKIILTLTLLFVTHHLSSTPSSLFWTYCTTDVLETGLGHIDIDNYFTIFNRRGHGQYFSPDVGLLFGVFTWKDLSAEAGIDCLGGADDPLYFNGKIGMKEGKLFKNAPSFSVGIFNVGTRTRTKNRTNQNVIDLVLGKSFEHFIFDNIYVGGYSGSHALGKVRQGFFVGAVKVLKTASDAEGNKYDQWKLIGDWASGHNILGGGGVALVYNFTPAIDIITGPVWFNTERYNGKWKWSTQVDISFPLCSK